MTDFNDVPLIPRRLLLDNPSRLDPGLSPDGRRLAWLAPVDGVMNVWVAPADALDQAEPLTRRSGRPVAWHEWSSDGRYILFFQDETGDENYHLYVVDPDDGEVRDLTPYPSVTARILILSPDLPGRLILGTNDRDAQWFDAWDVDLVNGERTLVFENTERIGRMIFDWQGRMRFARRSVGRSGDDEVLRVVDGELEPWVTIPGEDVLLTGFHIFNRAGSHLSRISSVGRNTAALIRMDVETGAETVLVEHADADVMRVLYDPRTFEPVAAAVDPGRREWITLDPAAGETLGQIAAAVPDADFDIISMSEDNDRWIAAAWSPRMAATYFMIDRKAATVTKLFSARPDLEPFTLANMQMIRIPSRDGLSLVSFLTLPADEPDDRPRQPLPMVLHVHGGPWWRDTYGYRRDHQWYANRGYAVLSVNYRASTGFGKEFVNAGDREHAGKIHDDLVDAVKWAIGEGIADPEKVAIAGVSYGGYSAFVGATFTPDLFCCAIPIVGISELVTLMENMPPYWEGMKDLMYSRYADPATEDGRAFLRSRSPLYRVDDIRKPMLIGHGANDVRCTLEQSDLIVAAMQEKSIPVTYVVFPDEGHGFHKPENNIAFHAIAEAFLARHLGGRVEPVGDDFEGSSHEIRAGANILDDLFEGGSR